MKQSPPNTISQEADLLRQLVALEDQIRQEERFISLQSELPQEGLRPAQVRQAKNRIEQYNQRRRTILSSYKSRQYMRVLV